MISLTYPPKAVLCTLDVSSLYTNIPYKEGIKPYKGYWSYIGPHSNAIQQFHNGLTQKCTSRVSSNRNGQKNRKIGIWTLENRKKIGIL